MSAPCTRRVLDRAEHVRACGPIAEMPTTTSAAVTGMSAPAEASSSADSVAVDTAPGPPAMYADHLVGVERRPALARVEHPEPPGRARPDVDQAPAGLQARHDRVDRRRDLGPGRRDRQRHGLVVLVHQPHELVRGQPVDLGAFRPRPFGGEMAQSCHPWIRSRNKVGRSSSRAAPSSPSPSGARSSTPAGRCARSGARMSSPAANTPPDHDTTSTGGEVRSMAAVTVRANSAPAAAKIAAASSSPPRARSATSR